MDGSGVTLFNGAVREPKQIWMSLASRRIFHPILELWIRAAYRPAMDRLLPFRPRVVHFVGTGWDFMGFAMADFARRSQARLTVWPAVHPGTWGDDLIDLRLYHMADRVFCQSTNEIRHLQELGLDAAGLIRCGLPPMCSPDGDRERFRAVHSLSGRRTALCVGLRDAGKGYPALLAAWKIVQRTMPDAMLLLAGPGSSGPAPNESIIDLGVPDAEVLADAYAGCDVFCLPSAHESFGIAFIEAWSYGKPVICGPAPASREWIEDGVTGLHVSQDPQTIARALLDLLGNPDRAAMLGAAGRIFQQKQLTWDKTLASHMAAFRL